MWQILLQYNYIYTFLTLFFQKVGLQISAQLENLEHVKPDGDDFRWYLKVMSVSLFLKEFWCAGAISVNVTIIKSSPFSFDLECHLNF